MFNKSNASDEDLIRCISQPNYYLCKICTNYPACTGLALKRLSQKIKGDDKMIDLKQIENEINELKNKLDQKKDEYADAKESNLKEQYGDNFGCDNCVYSCCVGVRDDCTYCTKGECIYCNEYCDEYIPDNELSTYIRTNHCYDEYALGRLNSFFGVSDIMLHPELHQKALELLTLRDKED